MEFLMTDVNSHYSFGAKLGKVTKGHVEIKVG